MVIPAIYFSEFTEFILNFLDCESELSCIVPYDLIIYFHQKISIFYSISFNTHKKL